MNTISIQFSYKYVLETILYGNTTGWNRKRTMEYMNGKYFGFTRTVLLNYDTVLSDITLQFPLQFIH